MYEVHVTVDIQGVVHAQVPRIMYSACTSPGACPRSANSVDNTPERQTFAYEFCVVLHAYCRDTYVR